MQVKHFPVRPKAFIDNFCIQKNYINIQKIKKQLTKIYMFKVNNENTGKRYKMFEVNNKDAKTTSGVVIVPFFIIFFPLVFLLLTLNR